MCYLYILLSLVFRTFGVVTHRYVCWLFTLIPVVFEVPCDFWSSLPTIQLTYLIVTRVTKRGVANQLLSQIVRC